MINWMRGLFEYIRIWMWVQRRLRHADYGCPNSPLVLSERDSRLVAEMLANPPAPTKGLRKLLDERKLAQSIEK